MRTGSDDLAIYKSFVAPPRTEGGSPTFCFLKEVNRVLSKVSPTEMKPEQSETERKRSRPLRILPNISGYSAVFMPGASAGFILKASTGLPHLIRLRGKSARWLDGFYVPEGGRGFILLDSSVHGSALSLQIACTDISYRMLCASANCPVGRSLTTSGP